MASEVEVIIPSVLFAVLQLPAQLHAAVTSTQHTQQLRVDVLNFNVVLWHFEKTTVARVCQACTSCRWCHAMFLAIHEVVVLLEQDIDA